MVNNILKTGLSTNFVVHIKCLLMNTVDLVIIRSILMEGKIAVVLDIKQLALTIEVL